MEIDDFKNMEDGLVATLAAAIENKLREMGDDIRGLTWFSSVAEFHPSNNVA